jgi:Glycosyl transferase family 2
MTRHTGDRAELEFSGLLCTGWYVPDGIPGQYLPAGKRNSAYCGGVITVVIPAHNESRVIGRLLGRLAPATGQDLDVIVVANGCTDDTAGAAAAYGPGVRVVSLPAASKHAALRAGDRAARGFPRLYVDADVEIGAADVRALAAAVGQPGVLAAAPGRRLDTARSSWPVRWYYAVWERLPQVRDGLFGRGVVAVGQPGHARLAALPPLLADDLAASAAFTAAERQVVTGAQAVIRVPRSLPDLLRRRVRAVTGTVQAQQAGLRAVASARTAPGDLVAIVRREPLLAPHAAVFLLVALVTRLAARRAVARGDYATWLRDESSRQE